MKETQCKTILVVDDEPINIMVLSDLLKSRYRVIAAKNGDQALARVTGEAIPDLILLDVMMPGMDGFDVCRQLKSKTETASIPVIFVTAMNDEVDETKGLEVGAVDYITKPISPAIVIARVQTHLALKAAQDKLFCQNEILEEKVKARTSELSTTQDVTILALASLAETRDNETGNHIRRTQFYVKSLAEDLVQQGIYTDELTKEHVDLIYKSAPLHDVGKVGIPDSILLKPGKLTEDEFIVMKSHPKIGADAISEAESSMSDQESSFLRYAREISLTHHEKWDGSGYPRGLSGAEIPLSGRLMAVADVYDALISKRVYKPAFDHKKAKSIILEGRGKHFDPEIVDAFLRQEHSFVEIAKKFKD
ncbi:MULTISPECIES: two-component system response regulator [unclassified Neptuniibacter]|uniref:response regulator n=1 Tax=unclassified Neptuniibacter TaxID=2630693 RepID=UPI000C5E0BF0|nr:MULTISPECIES: two-component system response regulator [unclassified Neptuniibacter]MAY42869.1 two-component system response regulator [Oceanospirillaceae bacterium]|tara:strand:- start:27627 stop:28718 length:1092 start_codon:yes stop_codon:yes gene_type:complete